MALLSNTAVAAAYAIANVLLAALVLWRSPANHLARFFAFCVGCLVVMGACGALASQEIGEFARTLVEDAMIFCYALLPSFFLHFIVIFSRREQILKSRNAIGAIYLAGLISYVPLLLGWIPGPVQPGGEVTESGFIFYVTWMSIFLAIGLTMVSSAMRNFTERQVKSNLLFSGFVLLLLILPGPFTGSLTSLIFRGNGVGYFCSSTVALTLAVYLVFRHRVIVQTPYDILRSVLSAMKDLLFTTDEALRIQVIGGPVGPLLGYNEGELIGHSVAELLPAEAPLLEYREKAVRGEAGATSFDSALIRKEGGFVSVSFSFAPLRSDEGVAGFLVVARDISDRKRAEDRIRIFAHAVESTSEFISITDLEDRLVFVNSAFLRRGGWSMDEVLGKRSAQFRSLSGRPDAGREIFEHTLKEGGWLGEVNAKKKDGTEVPTLLSTSQIRNHDGTLVGLIGVAHDISEQKRAIEALTKAETRFRSMFDSRPAGPQGASAAPHAIDAGSTVMMDRLAEKISEVVDKMGSALQKTLSFSTLASHELRTPLTIIRHQLENGLNLKTPESALRALVLSTYDEILGLSRTVETLLSLGAMQSGAFQLNLTPVDLRKLLKDFYAEAVLLSREKCIAVVLLPAEEVTVSCDSDRIRQLLFNLLDNSLKHTPEEGRIQIGCALEGNDAVIRYSDSGEGIPSDELPRIFDPFYRGRGGKRPSTGAGLGLAFAQWIVEAHHGSIAAESVQGEGTSFTIRLPAG